MHNATKYKVVSTYKNQDIGFGLLIPKSPTSEDGYGEGIIINSLGDTSDNFIRVLSETYKLSKSNLKFTNSVGASFVDLEKFAKKMTSQAEQTNARQLKLFFEGKDDVAEIFLNVNDKEGWVELKEKDEEYRLAIIDILAAK